jgi:hypothetical protein
MNAVIYFATTVKRVAHHNMQIILENYRMMYEVMHVTLSGDICIMTDEYSKMVRSFQYA